MATQCQAMKVLFLVGPTRASPGAGILGDRVHAMVGLSTFLRQGFCLFPLEKYMIQSATLTTPSPDGPLGTNRAGHLALYPEG